jgi:predicted TIM-barrel fold metal-dependent hydrolase
MNRRKVLKSAVALAWQDGRDSGRLVVDSHTHFYDPSRSQGVPWPPNSEAELYRTVLPEEFVSLTQGLGEVRTIVVEASPWLEDNQWILELASRHRVIAGFVGNLDLRDDAFRAHLDRFASNPLFRGIRLSGRSVEAAVPSGMLLDRLRHLAGRDLSLDVLGSASQMGAIEALARWVPDLRIIVDHLPFDEPPNPPERRVLAALSEHKNVYAKVSNVPRRLEGGVRRDAEYYRAALDELWGLFGEDRVLYGSNWPVSSRVAPYEVAFRIMEEYCGARGGSAAKKYFSENARAAYKWIDRGATR